MAAGIRGMSAGAGRKKSSGLGCDAGALRRRAALKAGSLPSPQRLLRELARAAGLQLIDV
jgi:hypothetical protein